MAPTSHRFLGERNPRSPLCSFHGVGGFGGEGGEKQRDRGGGRSCSTFKASRAAQTVVARGGGGGIRWGNETLVAHRVAFLTTLHIPSNPRCKVITVRNSCCVIILTEWIVLAHGPLMAADFETVTDQ